MERGKLKMANVKNKGVIYVTSLDMVKKYYDLKFQPIRYTIYDPDTTIIYIAHETNTITDSGVTRNIHGNRYFLLSKASKNIRMDCVDVYVRGEANGARYDSDEMDSFLINSDMYEITTDTQYAMGGSGTNGYINGTGGKVGLTSTITAPIRGEMSGQVSSSSVYINLTDDPSTTRFSIGATDLDSFYSSKYVSTKENPIYSVKNFYNRYSSKYYDAPDSDWWTDMYDLRTFYKV